MKISYIKSKKDNKSFRIFKNLGFDVYDIEDLEKVDEKIDELVKDNNTTIVITNELANFSENIIKKYGKEKYPNIIITPPRDV